MAQPTQSEVQAVDQVLTNLLIGYQNEDSRFIASRAFPVVPVAEKSGTYYIFTKRFWLFDEMATRAPGAQYARGGFPASTATYDTLQYALAFPIPDEVANASQVPMDLRDAGARWLATQSNIRKERQWATDFMVTGVWGTDVTGTTNFTKWNTYASSDPVSDVTTGKRTISQATGKAPNKFIMGEIVHDRLKLHPDVLDRLKYTQRATDATVMLAMADIFGVDEILVGMAIYDSADEGQSASLAPIIDDDALLIYSEPSPNIFSASAGYTFAWGGGGGTGVVMNNRDELNDTDLLKIKEQWDQKAVATDLGYFFSDAVD